MSTFLGWSSALIAAGTSVATIQSTFASILSSNNWQIVRQAVNCNPWSTGGTSFNNPANAIDIASNTSASTAALPAYIGINVSTGFVPTVMYIQTDINNIGNTTPLTFTLDYSDNGSSWTTLQSFTGQINWQYAERRKYTITGAASHNYWRMNVTAAQSGSTVYIAEFMLEDVNGNWLTNQNFFDCIPPITESIGNSITRECLRFIFNTTNIYVRSVQELLTALPQLNTIYSATAGAVTNSITINGATVSYIGSTGYTAFQNLRGLYEACKASVNANFTAWNWIWNAAHYTVSNGLCFGMVQKTPAMMQTVTSSNVTVSGRALSVYGVPLVQSSQFSTSVSITIDLINGWIYYMQINARGIALGSKTNSSYYAPFHACYGDNASAIAQLPTADLASYGIPCTPIELIVGTDNTVANCDGYGYPSHWWGAINVNAITPLRVDTGTDSPAPSLFTHHTFTAHIQDLSQTNTSSNGVQNNLALSMAGEGIFMGADTGTAYSIHQLSCNAGYGYAIGFNGNNSMRYTGPNYYGLDWYKFTGAAPSNEQLLISPSNDFTATISTTGTITDTTINVNSTTGFPTSGWLIMDNEIINYTGVTTTSFTGCVRGKYLTTPVSPIAGNTVNIGAWFCFINPGLVFAGYQIPT